MNQLTRFIIISLSIFIGLGVAIVALILLSPILVGGIVLWLTVAASAAFVFTLVRGILLVWLIADDSEKELTESDKNFSINQGKDLSK